MGLEAECAVVLHGRRMTVRVQLEAQELVLRGNSRTVIPFTQIRAATADGAWLRLELEGGEAAIELGEDQAAHWADRIRNPRSRLDKLGAKTGQRVAVLDVEDASFAAELDRHGVKTARARAGQELDLIFFGVSKRPALGRLAELRDAIRPEGAVWVTWPKGRPDLTEDHVRAEALRVGLVDVKVVAFSDTLSALKLVIPLARRPAAAKKPAAKAMSAPTVKARAPAAKAKRAPATKAKRTPATKAKRTATAKAKRTPAAQTKRTPPPRAARAPAGAARATRSARPAAAAKRVSARRPARSK